MKHYVIDTNVLMHTENLDLLIEKFENVIITYEVVSELDNLKAKDGSKGFEARRANRQLKKYLGLYQEVIADPHDKYAKVDDKLIHFALANNYVLVTNDDSMTMKARLLGLKDYEGYIEVHEVSNGWTRVGTDEEDSSVYNQPLALGEYMIVSDDEKGMYWDDIFRKQARGYEKVKPQSIQTHMMGKVKPLDAYQATAIHSLYNDDFTIITGKAGSGKTLLSLGYALSQIESGRRRKLVIFVNPTKVRGTDELGFYTGDRTEKLLQNSIGSILGSKFGHKEGLHRMLAQDQIEILPISDIRGFEVKPEDILYITEAQNLNTDMIKLCIQRAAEGCKVIFEGDPMTQVDSWYFEGKLNGLKRTIEVFNGFKGFGHVFLPVVRRSKLAEQAELI